MNCKPGDLAHIHATQPQRYGGHMVEVLSLVGRLGPEITADPGMFWTVRPLGWHPGEGLGDTFWFPDHRLRPIRDQDGQDETLRIAGLPAPIKTKEAA